MSSIDERIVEMTFKSAEFVRGVDETISALNKLKNGLNLHGASKDISDIESQGNKFNLSHMGQAVDKIASRFSAMRVVAFTALANITNRALDAGISLVKSFTIDPIKAGLQTYETKINAIQTILANTESEGTNLKQVTSALNQLNTYANKTVFNFGEMAKNIGVFTAAGVNLKTSVASIKGIANLAALSGSSSEQASSAMYQLSQAIAAGTVKLQDWNSVVNAGLGGKTFQTALERTARATGVNIDAIIKKAGSFRNSLQQGWLTSKILTQTLETFTGDLTDQQLKALGYSKQQVKEIQAQAKAAVDSATKIRTITQLQQALREEVATAWSQVWQAILGNIGTATKLLSKAHTTLENAFTNPLKNLAKLLEGFNKLGGRQVVIKALTNIFHALGAVLTPVKEAFRDIFPPATAEDLLHIAQTFEKLTEKLKLSAQGSEDLRKTFDGVFSIVKIVIDVIKGLFSALGQMFGAIKNGDDSFLGLTARIGDFLSHLRKTIESGTALKTFFQVLGKILATPIKLLGLAADALSHLGDAAKRLYDKAKPYLSKISEEFSKIGSAVANAISNGDISNLLHLLNQGLFAAVLFQVRKFISGFGKSLGTKKLGLLDTIKESFEGLTNTLKAMQTNLKSGTLIKIATAVALLTASIVALSFINAARLTKALAAISVMFTQLLVGMAIITKIAATGGIVKMGVIASSLNLLATSILILSAAVAVLSHFSWEELAKGLGSIAVLLIELVGAVKLMSGSNESLIRTAFAMNLLAVALNIMAAAVNKLGKQDFGTLAKGIGSIAVLLAVVAGFNQIDPGEKMVASAAAMLILGAALNVIAKAVETLGKLSMETLAKGLLGIATALIVIAGAMIVMPPNMIVTAAGLLIVSEALTILGKALKSMGGMSWEEIAKGLVTLAGSLLIIAAAMILMTEALPGAAALVVVSAALALLTPVLEALGAMSWESIAKGLVTLTGVFVILAAAGLLLTPLVPTLIGLGAAITLLGVGILAAGVGVLAFATALTVLSVAGGAAIGVLIGAIKSIVGLLPFIGKELGVALVNLAVAIGNGAPKLVNAIAKLLDAILTAIGKVIPKAAKVFGKVMDAILGAVNKYAPKIARTMANLLQTLLDTIDNHLPKFIRAGVSIIVDFLNGIASHIGKIAKAGGNVVIAFINAVGAQAGRIAKAGANMVINLINNVADTIRRDGPRIHNAAANLGSAIVGGLIAGITGGAGGVVSKLVGIAEAGLNAAKHALGINSPSKEFRKVGQFSMDGLELGFDDNAPNIVRAATSAGQSALEALSSSLSSVGDIISENMDLQPKITPVIDLSQAKKGFGDLANLSKSQIAAASTNKAASISASNAATAAALGASGVGSTNLTFNQYNSSPKALSTADIYRRTNNQLSKVKGALPK